jgi:hypothetical protein
VINRRAYINVYAPSGSQNRKNREKFFQQDAAFIPKNTDELMLLRDFNCVTSKKDAIAQEDNICRALVEPINGLELVDVWEELKRINSFTRINWVGKYGGGARLDRVYASKVMLQSMVNIEHKIMSFTDHNAVLVTNKNGKIQGRIKKSTLKMNTSVLRSDECKTKIGKILKTMKEIQPKLLPEYWKQTMKSRITQEVKAISQELSKTSDEYLKFLYRIVYELKREINEGRNSNKEYFETPLEIRDIEQNKAEAYRIRAK